MPLGLPWPRTSAAQRGPVTFPCRPEHPDPYGRVLLQIADAIEAAQAQSAKDRGAGMAAPAKKLPQELAIFYDWASLCQKDEDGQRSGEDQAAFSSALSCMQARPVGTPPVAPLPSERALTTLRLRCGTCTCRARCSF